MIQQKVFHNQFVPILRLEDTTVLKPQRGGECYQKDLVVYRTSCLNFLKILIKRPKNLKKDCPNLKLGLGLQNQDENPLELCYESFSEPSRRHIRFSYTFENNERYMFSFRKFELHGNLFKPTEIASPNRRDVYHFYKIRYEVAHKSQIFGKNGDV